MSYGSYERHNQSVKTFFKEQRAEHLLLEFSFDAGDSWDNLCRFLGKSIPQQDIPHVNKAEEYVNSDLEKGNQAMIEEQLMALEILSHHHPAYTDYEISDILNQLEAGIPVGALAKAYKVDEAVIHRWAVRMGRHKGTLVSKMRDLIDELQQLRSSYAKLAVENDTVKQKLQDLGGT